MQVVAAPLISEAWERHRRRRRLLMAAVTSAAVAAVIMWASGGLGTTTGGGQRFIGTVTVRASAVISRSPYMGIAVCHPSSSACYRVGLAVWLKRPALSVTATIDSVRSSLSRSDRRGIQLTAYVQRREFIGFFKPSGIVPHAYLRTPDTSPYIPTSIVRLTIYPRHGQTFVTRLRVPVEAGWG